MYANAIVRACNSTDADVFYAADGHTVAIVDAGNPRGWVQEYMAEHGFGLVDGTGWGDGPRRTTAARFVRIAGEGPRLSASPGARSYPESVRFLTVAIAEYSGPRPDLVCSRHDALVDVLLERGVVDSDTPVLDHARGSDVDGRHVLGILPHHLSSRAATITEVPMRTTMRDRKLMQAGDMSLARTRELAEEPVAYRVQRLDKLSRIAAAVEAAIATCTTVDRPSITFDKDTGRLFVAESVGQFTSEADVRFGLVRHHGPSGTTPWLDPRLSTGQWQKGRWVGESACAIVSR